MVQNRNALILSLARRLGIKDPRAALAVASAEGLGGGIGDRGTSFGPWQLHAGGALPSGLNNPQQWAWSNPGLLYALSRIKSVAGNHQGADAISQIVNRFERPANPGAEIQKALAYYRGNGASPPTNLALGTIPSAGNNSKLINAIINDQSLIPYIMRQRGRATGQPSPMLQPVAGATGSLPAELIYRNHFLKNGQAVAPIGGHDTHVHYASPTAQSMLRVLDLAHRMGLTERENPYVDPVDRVHARNSYHYRNFPGLYHGKHLGEAVDISGNPKLLMMLYRKLASGKY